MTSEEFTPLLRLAKTATTSEDAAEKWAANTELMTWFRSYPVEVIEALQAAARVSEFPGGRNNQRLHRSVAKLRAPERAKEIA